MLDDKTKALIIKYLRKAWLYSPARREVLKRSETGDKTNEGEKLFWCNSGTTFMHKVPKVYVDHFNPFIAIDGFDCWDKTIERLFDSNNMGCKCKLHHAIKTKAENKQRKRKPK